MKILHTAVFPLLLCALILALGFGAPALFNRLVPDQKGQVETVAIAGKESPLYLETDTDIALPPWDVISGEGVPLSSYTNDVDLDSADLNTYIAMLVEQLGLAQDRYEDYCAKLYVYNDQLLYLRDYELDCGDRYTLDVVLLMNTFAPLYLHVRNTTYDTAPVDSPDTLLSDFSNAAALWIELSQTSDAIEQQLLLEMDAQAAEMDAEDRARIFVDFFSMPLRQISALNADSLFYYRFVEEAYTWQNTLYAMLDTYTLTYEDETVIVLTNNFNRACTIYFDGAHNRVTGFGFDAATLGYSEQTTEQR